MDDIPDNSGLIWKRENIILVIIAILGLGITIYGLWMVMKPTEPKVEIIKAKNEGADSESLGKIYVDVSGAVEKPAVYTLKDKSRIGDAIIMAGGLAAAADREWVSKNLNLAQELKDGQKVYIPESKQNGTSDSQQVGMSDSWTVNSSVASRVVNINTASESQLKALWGIGEARAQTIINNRPYSETTELVTKAKIPQSVYDKIKDQISVY